MVGEGEELGEGNGFGGRRWVWSKRAPLFFAYLPLPISYSFNRMKPIFVFVGLGGRWV